MKKIISLAIFVFIIFLLIPGVAFAADNDLEIVTKQVNKTNEIIDKMIDIAIKQADNIEVANEEKADDLINKIIDRLIDKTNKMAENMIEKAAEQGIEVNCELIEVEIGDQIILVDPLRIGGT